MRPKRPSLLRCAHQQLRQPCDIDGDASCLVLRQHLCLPRLVLVVAGVEVSQRLPVGVSDDVAAGQLAPLTTNQLRAPRSSPGYPGS
jgi:hypothetical protein